MDGSTHQVTTVAGNGTKVHKDGQVTDACFNYPSGIALDGHGGLLVSDIFGNRIRHIHNVATPDTAEQLFAFVDYLFSGSGVGSRSVAVCVGVVVRIGFMAKVNVQLIIEYVVRGSRFA